MTFTSVRPSTFDDAVSLPGRTARRPTTRISAAFVDGSLATAPSRDYRWTHWKAKDLCTYRVGYRRGRYCFSTRICRLDRVILRPHLGHGLRWRGQSYPLRFGDVELELSDSVQVCRWP